jgi:hypothetical protein
LECVIKDWSIGKKEDFGLRISNFERYNRGASDLRQDELSVPRFQPSRFASGYAGHGRQLVKIDPGLRQKIVYTGFAELVFYSR